MEDGVRICLKLSDVIYGQPIMQQGKSLTNISFILPEQKKNLKKTEKQIFDKVCLT